MNNQTPKQAAKSAGTDLNDAVNYETEQGQVRRGFVDFEALSEDGIGLLQDLDTGETVSVTFSIELNHFKAN